MTPPVFADVWQTKDFKSNDFGSVARKEVTGGFSGCVANKGVSALARSEKMENKIEGGGYPIPGILQSVRKRVISKELEETLVLKCEASVRKGLEVKELEEIEEVDEAAWAALRRFIRDAKAAFRRG